MKLMHNTDRDIKSCLRHLINVSFRNWDFFKEVIQTCDVPIKGNFKYFKQALSVKKLTFYQGIIKISNRLAYQ